MMQQEIIAAAGILCLACGTAVQEDQASASRKVAVIEAIAQRYAANATIPIVLAQRSLDTVVVLTQDELRALGRRLPSIVSIQDHREAAECAEKTALPNHRCRVLQLEYYRDRGDTIEASVGVFALPASLKASSSTTQYFLQIAGETATIIGVGNVTVSHQAPK